MKKGFLNWFIETGWKSYTIPYILFIGLTICIVLGFGSLSEAPWGWIAVGCVAYFGFSVGITSSMIGDYKRDTK